MIQVVTVAAISRSSQILFPRTMAVTHWGSDNQHSSHFIRAFRKRYGQTPGEFVRQRTEAP